MRIASSEVTFSWNKLSKDVLSGTYCRIIHHMQLLFSKPFLLLSEVLNLLMLFPTVENYLFLSNSLNNGGPALQCCKVTRINIQVKFLSNSQVWIALLDSYMINEPPCSNSFISICHLVNVQVWIALWITANSN